MTPLPVCAAHRWTRGLAPYYRCMLCGRSGRRKGGVIAAYSENYQLEIRRRHGIEVSDALQRQREERDNFMERRSMEE